MTSLLFGVTATDAVTFSAVAVILASVAFAATVIPAGRAARVDPMWPCARISCHTGPRAAKLKVLKDSGEYCHGQDM